MRRINERTKLSKSAVNIARALIQAGVLRSPVWRFTATAPCRSAHTAGVKPAPARQNSKKTYGLSLVLHAVGSAAMVSAVWLGAAALSAHAEPVQRQFIFSQTVKTRANDCAERSLRKAYGELGQEIDFKFSPSKRALFESNAGITDGEVARIKGIEESYPNLIRIDVALCRPKQYLVSRMPLDIDNKANLKQYRIGFRSGTAAHRQYIEQNEVPRTVGVHSDTSLKKLLELDRIDFMIISMWGLKRIYTDSEIEKLYFYEHLSFEIELFHYLNKKHEAFSPVITKKLKELEASGFIDKAIAEHFND